MFDSDKLNHPSWSLDYLSALGIDRFNANKFWDKRYVSPRMVSQIVKTAYISKSSFSGLGMFAAKNLVRPTVVGYFSGRTLNTSTWDTVNPNYVAYARWTHPESNRPRSCFFEVMTPSKLINGGIHPRYLMNGSPHQMLANVGLKQEVFKINNRYRPVLLCTTLAPVKKNEELLLDYGVLYDTIYYEFLRKEELEPGDKSKSKFDKFILDHYMSWLSEDKRVSKLSVDSNQEFLRDFALTYINQKNN